MKPEVSEVPEEGSDKTKPVTGDAIGDTAYSERFVLKILLKLANLDTLKDEIQDKSFEDDLCTLWDMTAEKDVVLFLQKHEVLNLFNFALPVIDFPRIIEIIVGIVGNMCCQKEIVNVLMQMDNFMTLLLEYTKSDDSLILVQVLRLISSCLFLANNDDAAAWLNLFKDNGYSTVLYFILKNSSNKDLLVTALENLNTVCTYCNTENLRLDFFTQFVTLEALESLSTAFSEIAINQKDSCQREELERMLVVCLQIMLNFIGFDKSPEIYCDSKQDIIKIVSHILAYYENKLVKQKEVDSDLIDIIESTNTILSVLQLSEISDPDKYFQPCYRMWQALTAINNTNQNGSSNFEDADKEDCEEFSKQMKIPLGTLICKYMEKCSDSNLLKVLDEVGSNYEDIINSIVDEEIKSAVSKRAVNYRTRLKDNVDS